MPLPLPMTSPQDLESAARRALGEALGVRDEPTALGQAPGRTELLGNHTDYNGGHVLAAAIDRYTLVIGRPRPDRTARIHSINLEQTDSFPIDAIEPSEPGRWNRYVRGVTWAIQEEWGSLASGFEAVIAGGVPLGSGLSSSASLQAALAMFLGAAGLVGQGPLTGLDDPGRMRLARQLQRSENAFVGVSSGLLDQFSALFGRAGHALRLDCRTLDYERVPLGSGGGRPAPAIVVCDSGTSRRLADGLYNLRRAECERVVAYFQARPETSSAVGQLRDLSLEQLRAAWGELDPVARLRARHVLSENERVLRGAERLKAGDLAAFGRLMTASHASSRDDFANSAPALDALVEAARAAPGFLGGKLSGAGWAGCTVNLVAAEHAEAFAEAVRLDYRRRTGLTPAIHICQAAAGASGRAL